MTKLEETKSRQADNDAITDDVAAQAFVEQFAIETFQRADNAVRANKASAYVVHRAY
jgi:vacuolar protein sorting-associated protein VTA1